MLLPYFFIYLHAADTQDADREARYIVFDCVRSYHVRLLVIKSHFITPPLSALAAVLSRRAELIRGLIICSELM